jgi:tetratricopeptide (TPR) repeat protein
MPCARLLAALAISAGCITARAPYMDGLMYEREYKPAEAIAAYRDSIGMDPDFAPAHRRLAILLRVADPGAAAKHAAKVLAADPNDAEMASLRDAVQTESKPLPPKRFSFANARARVDALLEDGKDEEALHFLEGTVSDDPNACWAYERMQAIRARLHDAAGSDRAKRALAACRSTH